MRKFLKTIAKILLGILLVGAVLIGAFIIWLRAEPADVVACESGFQLIQHAEGADCVADDVNKILTLSPTFSQLLMFVGRPTAVKIELIDSFATADIPGLPQRFNEINEGVDDLGSITPTLANVELLLQIDPDVIVSANSMGDFSKPLETIGPVVILTHLDSWKEVMLFGSNLIDERQVAEALLAEYEMRVQILQAQFEDPSEITISYVRLFPESAHVQLSDSFARQIMQDVGFSFPEAQLELVESAPNEIEADFSAERIDLIDGDYLFLYGAQPDQLLENAGTSAETLVEAFQNDPLFQALEVAKANQVYETDLHWSVPGIYSAHAVLDDLFRHVAGVDPEEVAPNPLSLE